jgi:adenylate cyclase class 2
MIEAELKFRIDSLAVGVAERLDELATSRCADYSDTYYADPRVVPQGSDRELRLRTVRDPTGIVCRLTFKGAVIDSATGSKSEYEVGVTNAVEMDRLLTAMGFCRDLSFVKHCTEWRIDVDGPILVAMVTLEEIAGTFLEIERVVATERALPGALARIACLAAELGLTAAHRDASTYTESVRQARSALRQAHTVR